MQQTPIKKKKLLVIHVFYSNFRTDISVSYIISYLFFNSEIVNYFFHIFEITYIWEYILFNVLIIDKHLQSKLTGNQIRHPCQFLNLKKKYVYNNKDFNGYVLYPRKMLS